MPRHPLKLLPALLLVPGLAAAQAPDSSRLRLDSLLYRPLLVPLNAWQAPPLAPFAPGEISSNPAALPQAQLPAYGRLSGQARAEGGPWRRPQQARQGGTAGFAADGYHRRNSWHAYGAAGYERQQAAQVRWASIENPFDGNPYLWADTVAGAWQRDYLHARLEVARPLGPRLTAGLSLGYQAGQGARDADPRPQFQSRMLRAAPGLWWQHGRHAAGLSAQLAAGSEQNETGLNATQFPLLYRLRGLGTFSAAPTVTAERQTTTWHGAGQAQYQYTAADGTRWLTQAGGGYRRAAVELTELRNSDQNLPVLTLQPGGTLRETTAEGQLAVLRPAAWGRWQAWAGYAWLRRRGTDPLFGVVNTLEDQHRATAQVQALPGAAGRQAITLTLAVMQVEVQDQAARTRWLSRRGQGELAYLRRLGPAQSAQGRWSGFVQPGVGYAPQLAASFATGRPSRFIEALARPDYRAQTAPAAYASLGAGLERWLPTGRALRLRLHSSYVRTAALGYRAAGQASVEWLF